MNILPSSSDDDTRRAFLAQVENLLPAAGIAWTSVEYRPIRPFGRIGLVLTAPGRPGAAQVIAISLQSRQAIDYAHFPGSGKPYYQLLIQDAHAHFTEYCVSPDPKAIVASLKVWSMLGQEVQRQVLPSLGEHELAPLRRLATIRTSLSQTTQQALMHGIERCSDALGQELGLVRASDFSRMAEDVTPEARTTLTDDLRYLAPDLLMAHFPRETDGRLPLGATVLLTPYDSTLPQSRDRQMWLAACAPQRRRDPQVVTLCLASLIGVNHAHRWDQARWCWDVRQEAASLEQRWGVSGLDLSLLGLEKRAEHLVFFTERCARQDASLAERVSLCVLLQDEGRFEEAFSLFGIELTSDVLKILYNQPFSLTTAGHTTSWSAALLSVLFLAAPWRFAALPAGTQQRLCALPHQTQQRKACLMLKRPKGATPLLMVEATASNKLFPHVAWQRPTDLDLMRFRLR